MTRVLILIAICALNAATANCTSASPPGNVNQQPRRETSSNAVSNERIKQQAQELCDAMINANFEKAVELTYPKLIELMGGRAKYIAAVRGAMSQTQSEQFRIESVTAGEPRDSLR